jgi:hypothetical protein
MDALDPIPVVKLHKDFFLPRVDGLLPHNAYIVITSCFVICFASSMRYASSSMGLQDALEHLTIGVCNGLYFVFCVWQSYDTELTVIMDSMRSRGTARGSTGHSKVE